jgi:hypothetical protein
MLTQQDIKVGAIIKRLEKGMTSTSLILKIYTINYDSFMYDALITPSKQVVYKRLCSMFKYWNLVA